MPFSRGKAILFSVFSSRFTSKNALTSAVYANFGLIAFIRLSRQVFFLRKKRGEKWRPFVFPCTFSRNPLIVAWKASKHEYLFSQNNHQHIFPCNFSDRVCFHQKQSRLQAKNALRRVKVIIRELAFSIPLTTAICLITL